MHLSFSFSTSFEDASQIPKANDQSRPEATFLAELTNSTTPKRLTEVLTLKSATRVYEVSTRPPGRGATVAVGGVGVALDEAVPEVGGRGDLDAEAEVGCALLAEEEEGPAFPTSLVGVTGRELEPPGTR